jgi:hypothetical protein
MARTKAVFLALLLALLALDACKRAPDAAPADSGTPSAGSANVELAPAPPGTLFPTGVMLRGDKASLQYYLRNVDTVSDAKVDITYAPRTVLIGRNAAIRSLHSTSWDGVTWRFDAEEPAVRRIEPGSVVLVWGLAIRRVTQVEQVGDEIVLTTEEAQLTDAVSDAQISWNAPAHLLQGAMAMRVPKPEDSVKFIAASFEPRPSPFRFAAFEAQDSAAPDPPALYSESFKLKVGSYAVAMAFGAAAEDALNVYAQFAYGEDAEEPAGLPGEFDAAFKYGGKFADWVKKQQEARDKEAEAGKKKAKEIRDETKMTSGPGPGLRQPIPKTSEEQQRQKEEEDAEAEYEKKYGKPSRSSTEGKPKLPDMPKVPTSFTGALGSGWKELAARTAIKVTAAGTVSGFRSKGDISIKGGTLEHATLENPEFHLVGDVYWAIRIDLAVFAGRTHVEVPVTFRVPVIVGGLPMFLEIAVNAQIQPALTSKQATAKGQRHIDFRKGAALTVTTSGVSGEAGEATADAQKGPEEKITGLGVSGLMIALQVPRVGLGFGIIGSNLLAYFDVVVASGATYTGTTGIIQCTHSQLVANFNVGVSATFLGFPLGDARKAGPSKEWSWDDPPGRKCG